MARFDTTRWSLIAEAGGDAPQARPALEQLCRDYRPPVVAFLRGQGYAREDAEDLAQDFFERFVRQGWYATATPERGRFRALLLTALRRFVHSAEAHRRAARRGGHVRLVSIDEAEAASTGASPEAAFLHGWLAVLMSRARERLREEYRQQGRTAQFDALWGCIDGRASGKELDAIAAVQGLRRNTVAVQLHRMRKRLRQFVRLELLATVGSREDLELELAELREGLGLAHEAEADVGA